MIRAENRLNDEGIKLLPRVPPKKSKQNKGSRTATEAVKKLQASAAKSGQTNHGMPTNKNSDLPSLSGP
ncbi:MAG: hypothetical protein VXW87_04950 [Pseudomonadota bacterium]|nr:hypothetical protein [Pseudomonadota bacterium]